MTILMGPNGGGKSSLFNLLRSIRCPLVDHARVNDVFPAEESNAWAGGTRQAFELCVENGQDVYAYRLISFHNPDINKPRLDLEVLTIKGHPRFEFKIVEIINRYKR